MSIKINHNNLRSRNPKLSFSKVLSMEILTWRKGLSLKDKEFFYNELHLLLKSGLDFKTSLELMSENKANKSDDIYKKIYHSIISGKSLSEALENCKKFNHYDIYNIKIAEESGLLIEVLSDLSIFYANSRKHQKLLLNALSYPLIVISTAVLVLSFLINFLIPMFSSVYKRMGHDLPYLTKIIINLSDFIANNFFISIVSLVIFTSTLIINKKNNLQRRLISGIILKTPYIGYVVKQLYLARFCQSFYLLSRSKVPINLAIALLVEMIRFYPLEKSLKDIESSILNGNSLSSSIGKHNFFPPKMTTLIRIGEETNKIDIVFHQLAIQFSEEGEQSIKTLGTLLEPLIIILLAFVVGFILIAMYLPIFNLVGNFGI